MNKSSLLYWFPKIKGLEIPIPRTEIVQLAQEEIQAYRRYEGDTISFPRLNEKTRWVIQDMFSLPVFLRTDEYSGKHCWKKTCFLDDLNNLDRNLAEIIEGSLSQGCAVYKDGSTTVEDIPTAFSSDGINWLLVSEEYPQNQNPLVGKVIVNTNSPSCVYTAKIRIPKKTVDNLEFEEFELTNQQEIEEVKN